MRSRMRFVVPLSALALATFATAAMAASGTFNFTASLGTGPVADRTPLPSGFVFPTPLPAKTPGAVTPIPQRTPGLDSGRIQAWYAAGQARRADSAANATDVVAKIGRINVERRDLTYAQVLAGRTGQAKDLRSILESMKTPLAMEDEAVRRGFVPSLAELATFIAGERARIHVDAQGAAEWAAFFSGLGVSEDQYFALPEVVQELSYQWGVGRLHEAETKTLPSDQRESAWNDLVKTLVANVLVTILDPSLK